MGTGRYVHFHSSGDFLMISSDSWVCSDSTPSWTFGYASTESPHPTLIKTHSWTANLNGRQHKGAPTPLRESAGGGLLDREREGLVVERDYEK